MKFFIGMLIGLAGSALAICLDIRLVQYLFSLVPPSGYAKLIKMAIVFIDIWLTAGLCLLPFVLGFGIGAILSKE